MTDPQVVSRDEWLVVRTKLLAREKELTRQRDDVNAERRRLPMVEIDKEYVFEGLRFGERVPEPAAVMRLSSWRDIEPAGQRREELCGTSSPMNS